VKWKSGVCPFVPSISETYKGIAMRFILEVDKIFGKFTLHLKLLQTGGIGFI
jgi:hypothetical protein